MIVSNLEVPYYAVIFTSVLKDIEISSYYKTAKRMEEIAKEQQGFLGIDSSRTDIGITISYWKTLNDIINWKNNLEHKEAQIKGREEWYSKYQIRICKVEREYGFEDL
ncbi:MAG: antibiotic biosynthesis monooxygenase [Flavobacteriaceae bacterium]|nr:antibiotic biosynthesis monooxygenase [Flavobacteriaceae bacterium]